MENRSEVECTHIEGELMRVRFANLQIVSDHPTAWGGDNTGPAPGELVAMALASGSALAGRRHAAEHGLDVSYVGVRTSMSSTQEGLPEHLRHIPLPHLTYVDRFWRLLEIEGSLPADTLDGLVAAMKDNPIAQAIRDGIAIEETVEFRAAERAGSGASGKAGGNALLQGRPSLPSGEKRVAAKADNWLVSAAALDEHTCLLKAAGAMSVAGDEIARERGPTPEELLLGGLAACTTIYIARNAQFQDIPLESVRVRVSATGADGRSRPIARVRKIAEVAGDFSSAQAAALEQFANHCAFGITLGRGTAIEDIVSFGQTEASGAAPCRYGKLDVPAPPPDDPSYCSDGSCCVPLAGQPA